MLRSALAVAAGVPRGATPSYVGAENVGPVTDEIEVVMVPKDAALTVGGYWTLSGPDTALGLDRKRGVEIAFEERSNMVAGHKIKFVAEDSRYNAEGGRTAAAKLASDPNMVVVIGPDCSSAVIPGAPILWNVGIASAGTSAGAADAEYFAGKLGCKILKEFT